MLKYITSILFLLLSFASLAQDDDDSTEVVIPPRDSLKQLRFGVDISKPIVNSFSDKRKSYEFEADYYWKKELYIVGEAGWGNSTLVDTSLRFSSSNIFFKGGINKSMLSRVMPGDWDMAFIGFRYAIGFIDRGDAYYMTRDNYWGSTTGTIPGTNMTAHWAEVVSGVRLELYKGIFAGWNVRGKFLLNKRQFRELPPAFIAGYGAGDKNSNFDFNFYLSYAIRWRKQLKNPAVDSTALQ
jgi:hypothetical protein